MAALKRTKIMATLGPATDDPDVLYACLEAGVDLVRLNYSHGNWDDHAARVKHVRDYGRKTGHHIGILADLQGPKIRIARFAAGTIELNTGDNFTLDIKHPSDQGNQQVVGLDYPQLPQEVSAGDQLLLDDGRIKLVVQDIKDSQVITEVLVGGTLSDHKGINRVGGGLSANAISPKDQADLKHIVKLDVDYVALSFARGAEDVQQLRGCLETLNNHAGIIAKIERFEAMEHLDELIDVADGIMVARGDLAVEIGDAAVPGAQKRMISRARTLNKPVIVATQMMESMVKSSTPTRAEVSDVANAVLDAADAVMLSAETAMGDYPVACVQAMTRICQVAELEQSTQISHHRVTSQFQRTDEAISMAAMYVANHLDIQAVLTLTESGFTPLMMSRIRSGIPIYALCAHPRIRGKMTLYRDVYPIAFDLREHPEEHINQAAIQAVQKHGYLKPDDQVILSRGDRLGVHGGTNTLKILPVKALE